MTKSQIDRLGARLRAGEVSDVDLQLLDEYRRSFAGAYNEVMRRLHDEFDLDPTGRAAKSTFAILGKLRRESVRLSQIQDVAGSRVIVPDVPRQDDLVRALASAFAPASVINRRERPSHGYRAVHLVVTVEDRPVEIQVRTTAQQLWAELSERYSDQLGIDVKYGGGGERIQAVLSHLSDAVGELGAAEAELHAIHQELDISSLSQEERVAIDTADRALESVRLYLRRTVISLDRAP